MVGFGCATEKWRSSRPPALPVVLETAVKVGTTESEDGVGTFHRPERAGLFEAMTDDSFAAGFDDARADEQVLLAELGVVHASGVGGKIVGFVADLLRQVGIGGVHGMKRGDEFRDVAFIEPTFLMGRPI